MTNFGPKMTIFPDYLVYLNIQSFIFKMKGRFRIDFISIIIFSKKKKIEKCVFL